MPKVGVRWEDPNDPNRGTGRTRKALEGAARGAVFIWCNAHVGYPKQMALDLGRGDILIFGADDLVGHKLWGMTIPELILDHACRLTAEQWEGYDKLKTSVRHDNAKRFS